MRKKNMEKEEITFIPTIDIDQMVIQCKVIFLGILSSCKLNLWLVELMVSTSSVLRNFPPHIRQRSLNDTHFEV